MRRHAFDSLFPSACTKCLPAPQRRRSTYLMLPPFQPDDDCLLGTYVRSKVHDLNHHDPVGLPIGVRVAGDALADVLAHATAWLENAALLQRLEAVPGQHHHRLELPQAPAQLLAQQHLLPDALAGSVRDSAAGSQLEVLQPCPDTQNQRVICLDTCSRTNAGFTQATAAMSSPALAQVQRASCPALAAPQRASPHVRSAGTTGHLVDQKQAWCMTTLRTTANSVCCTNFALPD